MSPIKIMGWLAGVPILLTIALIFYSKEYERSHPPQHSNWVPDLRLDVLTVNVVIFLGILGMWLLYFAVFTFTLLYHAR